MTDGTAALAAPMGAVIALLMRDTFDTETYGTLTGPWLRAIGPIHPATPSCLETYRQAGINHDDVLQVCSS